MAQPGMNPQHQPNKPKEGMSVQEIENFGKRFRFEIFFFVCFARATIFSSVFFSMGWSIYLAGIGAVVAIWIPKHLDKLIKAVYQFVKKQEFVIQLTLAVVGIIISFFLPFLVFLFLGVMAGIGCHHQTGRQL